jgi:plastocyanin
MQRLVLALGLVAAAGLFAACGGASAAPATQAPAATAPATSGPTVVAKDMKFQQPSVTVPAGTAFSLVFDNQEGAPHNIAISDASGASVFKGEIVSNAKVTYSVPALTAGSYPFICEVHPDMKGTIVAE